MLTHPRKTTSICISIYTCFRSGMYLNTKICVLPQHVFWAYSTWNFLFTLGSYSFYSPWWKVLICVLCSFLRLQGLLIFISLIPNNKNQPRLKTSNSICSFCEANASGEVWTAGLYLTLMCIIWLMSSLQSAQLSQIVNSLMPPLSFSPLSKQSQTCKDRRTLPR